MQQTRSNGITVCEMAKMESCYRCGKVKLASINIHTDKHLTHDDLEMLLMSFGKNTGSYRCKDCKTESVF